MGNSNSQQRMRTTASFNIVVTRATGTGAVWTHGVDIGTNVSRQTVRSEGNAWNCKQATTRCKITVTTIYTIHLASATNYVHQMSVPHHKLTFGSRIFSTLPRMSSSMCPDSSKTLALYKSCTYLLTLLYLRCEGNMFTGMPSGRPFVVRCYLQWSL